MTPAFMGAMSAASIVDLVDPITSLTDTDVGGAYTFNGFEVTVRGSVTVAITPANVAPGFAGISPDGSHWVTSSAIDLAGSYLVYVRAIPVENQTITYTLTVGEETATWRVTGEPKAG